SSRLIPTSIAVFSPFSQITPKYSSLGSEFLELCCCHRVPLLSFGCRCSVVKNLAPLRLQEYQHIGHTCFFLSHPQRVTNIFLVYSKLHSQIFRGHVLL